MKNTDNLFSNILLVLAVIWALAAFFAAVLGRDIPCAIFTVTGIIAGVGSFATQTTAPNR